MSNFFRISEIYIAAISKHNLLLNILHNHSFLLFHDLNI